MGKFISILLKLGVFITLVIAATTKQEYSFYTFVRWVVMVSFIYFAYQCYIRKEIGLLIYFVATALLFNPFIKFWFQKSTWHLVDYIVAGITLGTIVFDLKKQNKLN